MLKSELIEYLEGIPYDGDIRIGADGREYETGEPVVLMVTDTCLDLSEADSEEHLWAGAEPIIYLVEDGELGLLDPAVSRKLGF
jgi:hypothetical protein